jgi:hypothetical protein
VGPVEFNRQAERKPLSLEKIGSPKLKLLGKISGYEHEHEYGNEDGNENGNGNGNLQGN